MSYINAATEAVGMKLVAICDTWEEKLNEVNEAHGVAVYPRFGT